MPETILVRRVHFRASHHYALPGLSAAENRARFGEVAEPHTHEWQVTVYLAGTPDECTGMVVDLPAVDSILGEVIIQPLQGRHINAVAPFFQRVPPSTEALATYFAERLIPRFEPTRLVKICVAEDDSLSSEYIP